MKKKSRKKLKTRARITSPRSAKQPARASASAVKPKTARATPVAADQQLGADQVAQILADCIPRGGGNDNEIVLSKTLQSYGFHFQNQVDTLTTLIIGNADFGVRRYGFRLSGDALNFATPSTTLSDVADAIQDKATPAQGRPAPVAQRETRPDIEVAERPHDEGAGGDRSGDFLGVVGDEFMEEEMEEPALRQEIEQAAGSTSLERRGEEERPQPEVVRRTPHMDLAPEAPLKPASSFEVWVSVDTNPPKPGETTEEIELRRAPSQEEFPVNVTLIVSSHFELMEDSVKQMIIFRSKESSPVTFKVRCVPEFPVEESAALSALFTYEEHPSGRVTRNFRVESGKLVPLQTVPEAINSRRTALEPKVALTSNLFKYDLTISVLDTGENDGCHFRFIADATAIGKRLDVPWNLSQKTEQIVSNYMKGFVVQGLEAGTRHDELTGAGIQLFRATPPDFQNLFWEMIDGGKPLKTIMVVSDDPYIPWELMVPRRTIPGRIETRKPLGVEFCVGRWIHSDYVTPPQQITLEKTYVVAPQYAISSKNLKWAPEEAKFVCEKFKPSKPIEPADLNKIKEALREQGVTLLHFVCHGAASAGTNQTVYLRDMVNNLSCSVVEGSEEFVTTFFRDHTFVFLNACEVGRTAPALVGINGFATTFLRLGASGVVAALWSVKDNIAHEVAMTFYEKVLQDPQTPFAEILRDIRSQAYSGNAEDTYAAYCFYGSPLARRKVLQA